MSVVEPESSPRAVPRCLRLPGAGSPTQRHDPCRGCRGGLTPWQDSNTGRPSTGIISWKVRTVWIHSTRMAQPCGFQPMKKIAVLYGFTVVLAVESGNLRKSREGTACVIILGTRARPHARRGRNITRAVIYARGPCRAVPRKESQRQPRAHAVVGPARSLPGGAGRQPRVCACVHCRSLHGAGKTTARVCTGRPCTVPERSPRVRPVVVSRYRPSVMQYPTRQRQPRAHPVVIRECTAGPCTAKLTAHARAVVT